MAPLKLLFVEDSIDTARKNVCIWFLCTVTGGRVELTEQALKEGISEVRWFTREELADEEVSPNVILEESWESFLTDSYNAKYLGFRVIVS